MHFVCLVSEVILLLIKKKLQLHCNHVQLVLLCEEDVVRVKSILVPKLVSPLLSACFFNNIIRVRITGELRGARLP